jgi:hypothetical protein
MEFSLAEVFLGAWAVVMTVLWVKSKEHHKLYKIVTLMNLKRLANKEIEVIDTGTAYEFKEIK